MISPAELALLALAGYRATQLVVHDSILDPVHTRIDTWQQQRPQSGYREAGVTLISCVYCAGWWLSGALLATWLLIAGRWDTAPVLVAGSSQSKGRTRRCCPPSRTAS